MKVDILSSVEGMIIPNKDKKLSSDSNFKNILNKTTDEVKPLEKKNSKDKFIDEKPIESKESKNVVNEANKEKSIKKTSIEKEESKVIEEKSSENGDEKNHVKDIDELLAVLTALGNKINENINPLIEDLGIRDLDFVEVDLLEQVTKEITTGVITSKDNNEIIDALDKLLMDLEGNKLITKDSNFILKEFVENKDFLGNDKFAEVVESLDKLVQSLDNIISLKDDTKVNYLLGDNEESLVGLNELIEKVTTVKENLAKLSNSLKPIVKEVKGLDEESSVEIDDTVNVIQSKEVDKGKESAFGSNNGASDGKSSEEDKEATVLNKIIGKDNNENKLFVPNKFMNFTVSNIDDIKQNIDIKTFSADTVKNIKFMVNNSIKELVVKVNPGNLGEVTIKLSMAGNEVKANISTTSKDIYSFINANEIKNALGNENLKVTEVNISLYQEDTTFFKNENGFNGSNREQGQKYGNDNEFTSLEENFIEEIDDISSLNIIV